MATFTQSTCTKILALPLNHLDSQDNLIWTTNKPQQFSVKSTYRIALKLKSGDWAEHSSTRQHGATRGRIWKLNVPLKVRNFIWRACSNCLPTRNNLWRRKVRIEATCDICQKLMFNTLQFRNSTHQTYFQSVFPKILKLERELTKVYELA